LSDRRDRLASSPTDNTRNPPDVAKRACPIWESGVDITVTPTSEGKEWNLMDLLGRSMGRIAEDPPKHFTIHPDGQALETMKGINGGPFASLDAALKRN
jgi:hypothetical protein